MPATPLFSVSVVLVLVSVFATLATLHFMVMFALGSGVVHFAAFGALSGETTTCSSRVPMSGSGMAISSVLSLLMWMLQCAGSTSVVAVLFVLVVTSSVRCHVARVTATHIFSAYRLLVVVGLLLRVAALGVVVCGCRRQAEVAGDARSPV